MFDIKPAVRLGTPALISLWGPSGSGKTYSALRIARGLVGKEGRIGVIDTENRRALFYAEVAGGWDHLDLQPPFSPDRYTAALKAFEDKGGYGCIIIDSMSHVWEGEGGVLDMAENGKTQNGAALKGLAKWQRPKMAYKRMVNNLLRGSMHVIFCLRAKEGVKQKGGGDTIEKTGLEPIAEKNFIYEMTVSVLLGPNHFPLHQALDERFKCSPMIPAVKAPDDIWSAIKPGQHLSEETGEAIADWVGGGVKVDHATEKERQIARDVATMGNEALTRHLKNLSREKKAMLTPIGDELRTIASRADEEYRAGADDDRTTDGDPLDDGAPKQGNGGAADDDGRPNPLM